MLCPRRGGWLVPKAHDHPFGPDQVVLPTPDHQLLPLLETTPSESPYDPNRWCWNFGQVVKLCVGTQSSCSADSFSTRPGVFLDLGLFRVSTPLRGPPPVPGVEVKCLLIPAGDSFHSRGVAQRLKPPRKLVWILQKVVIIITCCWGDTEVCDSPKMVYEQNRIYKILHTENPRYFLKN